MPTIYASPGNVLRMQTIDDRILSFREISLQACLNDIHSITQAYGGRQDFNVSATLARPKVSDSNQNQIIITWKGGNQVNHEIIYEWLTAK